MVEGRQVLRVQSLPFSGYLEGGGVAEIQTFAWHTLNFVSVEVFVLEKTPWCSKPLVH